MTTTTHRLVHAGTGALIAERIERATSVPRRMKGLLGRSRLDHGQGIWLEPAPSIHTFFMRFAIDVIFLDREGHVLKLVESLPAWRFASARGARTAVELPPGTIARSGLAEGDRLELRPPEAPR